MLSSSVVFISVVFVIPTVSLTPDCRVTSSSTLTVKHRNLTTTFWGFINIVEERSFLSLRFYENGLPLLCIEYNHTHVTIHEIKRLDSTGRTSEPVPWPVCSEWRQFHLVVHRNILAITDDHNITWVSRNIHQSATHLELVMHHLKPSCTTRECCALTGPEERDFLMLRRWTSGLCSGLPSLPNPGLGARRPHVHTVRLLSPPPAGPLEIDLGWRFGSPVSPWSQISAGEGSKSDVQPHHSPPLSCRDDSRVFSSLPRSRSVLT